MNIEKTIVEVDIDLIIPNRFQPRLTFEDKGLEDLANSIKQHGIIQPLVLRKTGDKYEIIAGERRFKAATMAGLKKVPAVIANIDDNKSAEVAIVENVQRRDLSAIEEARSYKNLLDKGYLTQSELAKKMGLSQSAIANKLRLLNLDEEVQEALLNNEISERHARSLLVLDKAEEQKEWLHKIISNRLTVRQLDDAIKKANNSTSEENNSDNNINNVVLEKEVAESSNQEDISGNKNGEAKKVQEDVEEDIPLVKPLDIDAIKEKATTLPNINPNSEIARKLREIEQEKQFNPDIIPVEQAQNDAKTNFFNFLENETVNMNTAETEIKAPTNVDMPSLDNAGDTTEENKEEKDERGEKNSKIPTEEVKSESEIVDMPFNIATDIPTLNNEESSSEEPKDQNNEIQNEQVQNAEAPNIEENNVDDKKIEEEVSIKEDKENKQEEVKTNKFNLEPPVLAEKEEQVEVDFDPVSLIDKIGTNLEPNSNSSSSKTDLKIAINDIRNIKEELISKGYDLSLEETDLEDNYQFIIKINKKSS